MIASPLAFLITVAIVGWNWTVVIGSDKQALLTGPMLRPGGESPL